jgi:methanogenic corrinoid protein MtbC1
MRPGGPASLPSATPTAAAAQHSWPVFQQRLLAALVAYNQPAAEQVWGEVCALFPPEAICVELLGPVQTLVGEGWHRGEISVTSEHFASRFVQTKLLNLFNASAEQADGPMAIVCCAQGELHEIGAIMLALFLRWNGFRVVYLGQNVPNSTIEDMVEQLRPQALVLSASIVQAANNLIEVSHMLEGVTSPRPVFVYGGRAFQDRPELQTRILGGTFLRGDLRQIVGQIAALVRNA